MGARIDSAGDGIDNIVLSSGCGFASVWAKTGATTSPVTPASETIAARARVSKADLNMHISTVIPARRAIGYSRPSRYAAACSRGW